MGNLSKHFSRHEFACKCGCGFETCDAKTLELLEEVRNHFGFPVYISGPNRCAYHNVTVRGRPRSKHLQGCAVDFMVVKSVDTNNPDYLVEAVPAAIVYDYLDVKYPDTYGLGKYDNRVHADPRSNKARWDRTTP